MIFGNSGGVSEAVLRYSYEKVTGEKLEDVKMEVVRGEEGLRVAEVALKDKTLRLAVVHGLAQAKKIMHQIEKGEVSYDIIEVMSCPGGCIGGAGQPLTGRRWPIRTAFASSMTARSFSEVSARRSSSRTRR